MHDVVILTASSRHDGKSLAEIAKTEISKFSGGVASVAVFIVLIVALAGLGVVVVNALAESSWGTFTIAATIPGRLNSSRISLDFSRSICVLGTKICQYFGALYSGIEVCI